MNDNGHLELIVYEVTLRATGKKSYQAALTAEDAVKQAGWPIDECFVFAQNPRRQAVPDHDSILLYRIPCLTCPFQYTECRKPDTEDCPTRPTAPELQNWLKQAAEAHLCNYVGEDLSMKDYHLGQKWCPIEQALRELA